MIRFFIALLALLFLPSAWSAFHNYDIEDGLSQSVVFDIVQDQQGLCGFQHRQANPLMAMNLLYSQHLMRQIA